MSRPISIATAYKSDPIASPMDSLGRSIGAQQIVDSICGSPIRSSRHSSNGQGDRLSETPEFTLSAFFNQGGRFLGQNAAPAFGGLTNCAPSAAPSENYGLEALTHQQQQQPCTCHVHTGSSGAGQVTPFGGLNNNYLSKHWNDALVAQHRQLVMQQQSIETLLMATRNFTLGARPEPTPVPQPHRVVAPPPQQVSNVFSAKSSRDVSPSDDLLARYRANPAMMKGLKLSDVRGMLLKFAQDQVGSRFIQQKLEFSDLNEKDAIFDEVLENTNELVDDIFGNYVVQKFFEYGEERHWNRLVEAMLGKVDEYAFQMYACRVLQKALEKVNEPLQLKILYQIRKVTPSCMKDQNGNHVIQKAIEKVDPSYVQFIVDALLETPNTIYEMSVDPYGCRVVQRCLEHCTSLQTRPMIERIHERFDEVTNNQYGNYVVQHVIQHGTDDDRRRIVERVSGNLLEYATHKYSSNVIEKCLMMGTGYHRGLLVKAACHMPEGSVPIVVQMMKDQYANYVVQKMFDQVSTEQRRELILTVRPHIPVLRQYPHGKHILAKLDKYFQKQVVVNYPYPEM